MATPFELAAAHIQSSFPDQFFIPIRDFARVTSESFGGVRNKIAAGDFPLPTILQGTRRFVTAPDLIQYLAEKYAAARGETLQVEEKVATPVATGETEKRGRGCPKKYSKAARQAAAERARQARARKNQSGAGQEVRHG
ncbi:MAG: hypothetical protein H6R18_2270 [Proteobacteria bacterium]|nr:hypothetical protein [Pseudomonadota bacterium]